MGLPHDILAPLVCWLANWPPHAPPPHLKMTNLAQIPHHSHCHCPKLVAKHAIAGCDVADYPDLGSWPHQFAALASQIWSHACVHLSSWCTMRGPRSSWRCSKILGMAWRDGQRCARRQLRPLLWKSRHHIVVVFVHHGESLGLPSSQLGQLPLKAMDGVLQPLQLHDLRNGVCQNHLERWRSGFFLFLKFCQPPFPVCDKNFLLFLNDERSSKCLPGLCHCLLGSFHPLLFPFDEPLRWLDALGNWAFPGSRDCLPQSLNCGVHLVVLAQSGKDTLQLDHSGTGCLHGLIWRQWLAGFRLLLNGLCFGLNLRLFGHWWNLLGHSLHTFAVGFRRVWLVAHLPLVGWRTWATQNGAPHSLLDVVLQHPLPVASHVTSWKLRKKTPCCSSSARARRSLSKMAWAKMAWAKMATEWWQDKTTLDNNRSWGESGARLMNSPFCVDLGSKPRRNPSPCKLRPTFVAAAMTTSLGITTPPPRFPRSNCTSSTSSPLSLLRCPFPNISSPTLLPNTLFPTNAHRWLCGWEPHSSPTKSTLLFQCSFMMKSSSTSWHGWKSMIVFACCSVLAGWERTKCNPQLSNFEQQRNFFCAIAGGAKGWRRQEWTQHLSVEVPHKRVAKTTDANTKRQKKNQEEKLQLVRLRNNRQETCLKRSRSQVRWTK